MRVLQTLSDVDAYFGEAIRDSVKAIRDGLEEGLSTVAEEMRQGAPPDAPREWNLRRSIGVDDRIPRQKGPIPGLEQRQDYQVRIRSGEVTGVIAIAMTYTVHVIRKNDFRRPALQRADRNVSMPIVERLARVAA